MSIAKSIKDKIYEVKPKYFSHGDIVKNLIHSRIEHYITVPEATAIIKPKEEFFPAIFEYEDGSMLIIKEYSILVGAIEKEKVDTYNPYEDNTRVDK